MNHTQVTIKLWRDTRDILRQISRMTREPQVLVLHRLLMVEQRRLRVGSDDAESMRVEVPSTDAAALPMAAESQEAIKG